MPDLESLTVTAWNCLSSGGAAQMLLPPAHTHEVGSTLPRGYLALSGV